MCTQILSLCFDFSYFKDEVWKIELNQIWLRKEREIRGHLREPHLDLSSSTSDSAGGDWTGSPCHAFNTSLVTCSGYLLPSSKSLPKAPGHLLQGAPPDHTGFKTKLPPSAEGTVEARYLRIKYQPITFCCVTSLYIATLQDSSKDQMRWFL